MWRAVGVQVQAVACAFPTPQQRSSDHLFRASGDHKTLTRMCAKCNIVLRFSLAWGPPLSVSLPLWLHVSQCISSMIPPPVRSSKLQANCVLFSPVRAGKLRSATFTGLKRRAALAVITFGTSLCMCCSWIRAATMSKLVCVTSHLRYDCVPNQKVTRKPVCVLRRYKNTLKHFRLVFTFPLINVSTLCHKLLLNLKYSCSSIACGFMRDVSPVQYTDTQSFIYWHP